MNALILLTLLNIPRVSRKTVNYILKVTDSIDLNEDNIIKVFMKAKDSNKKINIPTKEQIREAKNKAENIITESKNEGINIITVLDEDFPDKLKDINDPPVLLYYKGNKECLNEEKSVAIIGTRMPTNKGIEIADKLGTFFAKEGFVVVSGLAKGCDELGHKGCVKVNGKSIAVLPCGLDTIYLASNKNLAKEIIENDGCLLSEYPIKTKSFKNYYVERDRLKSGLSQAVIVVETNLSSGTMHTVGFAEEQNRIIACYKHSAEYLQDEQTKGNQLLIKDGRAIGIYSKNEIINLKDQILKRIDTSDKKIENNKETIIQTSMF